MVSEATAGDWQEKAGTITDEALRALSIAGRLAAEAGRETALEDLFAGILAVNDGAAVLALGQAGVPEQTIQTLAAAGEPRTEKGPHASGPVRDVLTQAMTLSLRAKDGFVGTGHLLLGMARSEDAQATLGPLGIDLDELATAILAAIAERPEHRSPVRVPPTHPEFTRRLHHATLIYRFARNQEGTVAAPAAEAGRLLWERFAEAMRLTLAARGEDTTLEDLAAAEREAIALLDTAIDHATRSLNELGLEPPAGDGGEAGDSTS